MQAPGESRYRLLALTVLHEAEGHVVEVVAESRPVLFKAFGLR